jgi:hypothetical protein
LQATQAFGASLADLYAIRVFLDCDGLAFETVLVGQEAEALSEEVFQLCVEDDLLVYFKVVLAEVVLLQFMVDEGFMEEDHFLRMDVVGGEVGEGLAGVIAACSLEFGGGVLPELAMGTKEDLFPVE